MEMRGQLRVLEDSLEDRRDRAEAEQVVADEELRRVERLERLGVKDDPERSKRAKACRCNACSDCRPEIARVAAILDRPFDFVLVYAEKALGIALDQLLELRGPVVDRAHKRRQDRFDQKQGKRRAKSHAGRVTK